MAGRKTSSTRSARPALAFPETIVDVREEDLLSLARWMRTHVDRAIADAAGELAAAVANLRALSPQATLDRGYSILLSEGSVVSNAADARKGQEVEAVLARGRLALAVVAVEEDGAAAEEEGLAEEDGGAEEGLAADRHNLTAAAPQGGKHAQEERP